MEKVFTVIEVSGDKRVNIGTFYLTGESNIWWNTVKNRLLGLGFTWSRFVEELTTALLSAEWELTNVCGAVAGATHCCLFLKTEGCRQGFSPLTPATIGRDHMLSNKKIIVSGTVDLIATHSFIFLPCK